MRNPRNVTVVVAQFSVFVFFLFGLVACGGGGSSASSQSSANPSSAAKASVIAVGDASCPFGGILVESGIDDNANGVLDSNEVDSSEKVCNGETGINSLIVISPEVAGVNCSDGGKKIDTGLDLNANGNLDSIEITQTGYVCNGTGGGVGWKQAAIIETDDQGDADEPRLAIDGNDNIIAVWQQSTGFASHAWSNRYVSGVGWGIAQRIDTNTADNSFVSNVAVDANGNAVALWTQLGVVGTANLWANYYTSGVGWGTAGLVEKVDTGAAGASSVVMDNSGNAIAVWYQSDGTFFNVWSSRYVPGSGWGAPELIELNAQDATWTPKVAIDSSGNIIAAWVHSNGTTYDIWSNRYVPGSGWGAANLIEPINTGFYDPGLQIAMDSSGNATLVWNQLEGTTSNIASKRYTAGTGWGVAAFIDQTHAANTASMPQIAIDSGGNAVVVWIQVDSTPSLMWANRFVPATGWGLAEVIDMDASGLGSTRPQVAVDASGNAEAVWEKSDGTRFNIWANRFVPGTGWGTAEQIENNNTGDAYRAQVVLNTAGNATAVWRQTDGTHFSIWSNRRQAQ